MADHRRVPLTMQLRHLIAEHGTSLMVAGIVIGLAAPPLASALHPALPVFTFLTTMATMLRLDWRQVAAQIRRPTRVALVLGWTLFGTPLLMALALRMIDLPSGLSQSLVLWSGCAPLSSAAAIALLLDLDAALALVAAMLGILVMPVSLPLIGGVLGGLPLDLGIADMMRRLVEFVGGAALAAAILSRVAGSERLRRHRPTLDSSMVILLVLFAIAAMDGVTATALTQPAKVAGFVGAAFVASLGMQAANTLVFGKLGWRGALTAGLLGGNRNMAVVIAALGAAASPDLLLFFAAAQFPIYILPAALAPLYRVALRRTDTLSGAV
ncbi:MAG TPA: hypothetical protein VNT30_15020 [Stellaceae bacterium]|nr:hypothetical protein [Stellaceae bacterium]